MDFEEDPMEPDSMESLMGTIDIPVEDNVTSDMSSSFPEDILDLPATFGGCSTWSLSSHVLQKGKGIEWLKTGFVATGELSRLLAKENPTPRLTEPVKHYYS